LPCFLLQFPPNSKVTKIGGRSAALVIAETVQDAIAIAIAKIPESRAGWANAVVTDLSAFAISDPDRGWLLGFGGGDYIGNNGSGGS
jgi:hypothetical protein